MKNNKKFFCTLMVLILALTTYSPTFSFAFPKENNVSEKVITQANDVSIGATGTASIADSMIYGPWFGNGEEVWTTSVQEWADFVSRVSAVVQRVVPDPTAKLIAKSLYGAAEVVIATGFEIDYTYGTVYKSNREVKYSDGSFAYFQSKYVVVATVVDTSGREEDLPAVTHYYEGSYPMRIVDEVAF